MYETTIRYDNSNCEFDFDGEIRATMNWWHGEETDSGQDLETNMREMTFVFQDKRDAIKASKALEGLLGNYFEPVERIIVTDKPKEPDGPEALRKPKSTDPIIEDFATDRPRIPGERVSTLALKRRAGLKCRDRIEATGRCAAREVFDRLSERLGWGLEKQANVLVNWCGEDMIEPLLRHI